MKSSTDRVIAAAPQDDEPLQRAPIAQTYEVVRTLDEGGMGPVLEVTHRRLGKRLALKLIRPVHLAQPHARRAFVREARLASRLHHPNIVSVLDVAEDPEQGVYLILELVDGRPLLERLSEGRLPVRAALDVLAQVADALAYVHAQGFVHLDLDPENILLVGEAGRERVKLLDSGLARPSGQVPTTPRLDGTPCYLAPERILRTAGGPHPSMDVYALGVLAFELLTGRPPFDGSLAEVLSGHVGLPPPRFADLGQVDLAPEVEALVRRALAKRPEDRHADARAFLHEARGLRRTLSARPARPSLPRAQLLLGMALHAGPWPSAIVDGDGIIRAANPAFARFLVEDAYARVEGHSLAAPGFARIYPGFADDAATVRAGGSVPPALLVGPGDRRVRALVSRADVQLVLLQLVPA